jgi:hypothetical protein
VVDALLLICGLLSLVAACVCFWVVVACVVWEVVEPSSWVEVAGWWMWV